MPKARDIHVNISGLAVGDSSGFLCDCILERKSTQEVKGLASGKSDSVLCILTDVLGHAGQVPCSPDS